MTLTGSPRIGRGIISAFACAALVAAVATQSVVATAAPALAAEATDADGVSSFTLPVLPDTQFYSRYSASQFYPQYGTNPFEVQTQWLVDSQDELNIPFVVHVGDVVDQQWVAGEWTAAAKAMKNLTDGGLAYSVLPGNHDVEDQGARSSAANADNYLANFGASQMAAQGGDALIGTFQNGLSSAYLFEAEGHQWMSLAIAWNASDDTFAWAQGILDAHPNTPVILSSHAIIGIAADQLSPASWWWGDRLWDTLIKSNDQIILTVNGHFHGATMRTLTNDAGHPVYEVLTDYQMAADGGNGYMTLFEFDLTHNKIDVESVSPWITVKDADSITSSDTPVLDGTWQSFSMDLDFADRFGWSVDARDEDNADLSALAREMVSEGWDHDGNGEDLAAAGSAQDYIEVDGTIAHWRFGTVAEGIVDEHSVIPDIAGGSPMFRNPIEDTDNPDELDDVAVTHENVAYYSADSGAICFDDVSRSDPDGETLAFITTEYGAPATFATLGKDQGYTIETFLQLDDEWSEANNRWGAAITRGGVRDWMGIPDSADGGAGPAWLGISSLREYQYAAADADTAASYTLWSGEIMQGSWHHVAIVNDPVADTAIMYVDGVPVLRNASGVGGMMAQDYMPWIIGSSTWNTEMDHGWFGCVGETRIVDHALDSSEFLYQRLDIDAGGANFSVSSAPEGMLPVGTTIETLSGTGYPGAHMRVETLGDGATGARGVLGMATPGATVLGTTTVGANGTWTVTLASPIAGSGAHSARVVQSIGTRDGLGLAVSFLIAAAPNPNPNPNPTPGSPNGPGPVANPSHNDPIAFAGDDLASTGATAPIAVLLTVALLLVGAGVALRSRRKRVS